jgi:hypothetical protein
MKLIVMIPRPPKLPERDTLGWLVPAVAIVKTWNPTPGEHVHNTRTQAGRQRDFCVDDFDIYVWDIERLFYDLGYAIFG